MNEKKTDIIRLKIGRIAIAVIFVIASTISIFGQKYYMDAGFPYMQNFSSKEYTAHSQNFAIAQDHRGLMYFGNFAGILEFDGSSWNTILTTNISKVSSLVADDKGRIYVGARGEFGYLQANALGEMGFVSLSGNAFMQDKIIGDVHYAYSLNEKVFFIAEKSIFIYNQEKIEAIDAENKIISAFLVNETLFCQIKNIGLCKLENNKLKLIHGGDMFSGAIDIKSIIEHSPNQYIIASDIQGLYLMNASGINPFKNTAQSYLINNKLTCGIKLLDNTYAFGTKRGGIISIYPDGTLKQVLAKQAGLQNEYVNYLFASKNGLWAALNNGLTRIETPSPLSYHDESSGLKGGVLDLGRYKNQLYVATYHGLYYQDKNTALFQSVPEIKSACWSILPFDDYILAASSNGLFQISNGNVKQLNNDFCLFIYHYKKDNDLLFIGYSEGVIIYNNIAGNWIEKERIKDITEEIREIGEDISGKLWFVTTSKGVYSYQARNKQLNSYNQDDSLPSLFGNHICKLNNDLVFSTLKGLYKYEETSKVFEQYKIPNSDSLFSNQWFYRIFEDADKNLWTINGDETNLALYQRNQENKLIKNQIPFMQISDFVVWDILFDKKGVIWIGGSNGLIRYQQKTNSNYKRTFHTLFRSISTANDSILYAGSFVNENQKAEFSQSEYLIPALKSGSNMSFSYSAVSYNYKEKIQYQYFLKGFDKVWSEWSTSRQKEYTNLPGGKYSFQIKAKDIFNNISQEAVYKFKVLTPWYLQWWAYIIYFLLFAAIVSLIVIWRAQKLVKEKKELENLVEDRTAEILEQKEEIEKQSLGIAQKNAELEKINFIVKSINSEINLTNMLLSILEKTKVIKGVEKATALLYDEKTKAYMYKASYGWNLDAMGLSKIELNQSQAEYRYIHDTEEIFEDIFYAPEVSYSQAIEELDKLEKPKSMLVLVLKIENRVEGFVILENMHVLNAFTESDLSLIKNLKEHIISAFIRAKILEDLQSTLTHLKDTQEELIRQEKLASVGKLTKGIVDRVINPLNYINNFSMLSSEMIDELKEVLEEEKEKIQTLSLEESEEIIDMLAGNMSKIKSHGTNAARIVKAMEGLLKDKSYIFTITEINSLLEKKTELAIKETSAKYNNQQIKLSTNYAENAGSVDIMHEEFGQVIHSLVDNAFYVLLEKAKSTPGFNPEIMLETKKLNSEVEIKITDNGPGISSSRNR